MIKFINMSLRNFMSYGNNLTKIDFYQSGTTLILGENLDDMSDGMSSNGVGKSTLFNALVYALYDKPITDISKDNLVNNINKKNMEVTVEFEIDENNYIIKRERKTKAGAAGNNIYLWINGEDKTLDSAANTNKKIEEILGISYDLFVRIVVFFASHTPFLDLPKSNQADMFEQIVGLTILSEKANKLKDDIKNNETVIQTKKQILRALEQEQLRHNNLIVDMANKQTVWYNENQRTIRELESKLTKVQDIDIEKQQQIYNQLTQLNSDISTNNTTLQQYNSNIEQIDKRTKKIKSELTHLENHECPYCLQQYKDTDNKITAKYIELQELYNAQHELEKQVDSLMSCISTLQLEYTQTKQQLVAPNIRELMLIKEQYFNIIDRIELLKTTPNPYDEVCVELSQVALNPIDYTEINELTSIIDHQKFLYKLLTKKDSFIRKALLTKYIPYLNTRLKQYLSNMGLPHSVTFTHEMTAIIARMGKAMDFGNLSTGQRARVNFALSLAFSDMLQYLHRKVNICLLDEVLDYGLDPVGVQKAVKMLKSKASDDETSMYIISHRDETSGTFERNMTVQMIKGFSYVKESTN